MKVSINCCEKVRIDIEMLKSKNYKPTILGFIVVAFVVGLFGFAYWADMSLPTMIKVKDEDQHPNSFIGERAKRHLQSLVDLGPKVTGTYENEVLAVNYLRKHIQHIIDNAASTQFIILDVQKASGEYYLDMHPYGLMNVYEDIQNVVVKINSDNSPYSILINCHYDTVPNSPGGTDDCINCATMLEVLRVLSLKRNRPKHNIIFLFNGAEENPLQGSHAFITKHKWKNEVKILINLESVGAGGREILFQIGPDNPWLTDYYSQVPHPHAQVAGEEVFQSNLVPSDTDFRVFKKYSNLTGYDIAFSQNGYVYHTKYDDIDVISDGTFQHVGDNLLTLVQLVANATEVGQHITPLGRVVYYDVLGLFFIHYTETVGYIINTVTILISFIAFGLSIYFTGLGISWRYILLSAGAMMSSWLVSIGFAALIGVILDWWNCTMSWFGSQWLIFGLYSFPTVAITSLFLVLLNKWKYQANVPHNVQIQLQIQTNRLIWTLVLLLLTAMSIRTAYVLQFPVLMNACTYLIIFGFGLHRRTEWTIVYIVGLILPTVFNLYLVRIVLALFIPIFGRSGSDQNPEILAAVLSVAFSIIVCSYYVPLTLTLKKPLYLVIGLFIMFILTIILIVTPVGFPYSDEKGSVRPQRFQIWHTDRTYYDENQTLIKEDSGYFMLHMDRNSQRSIKEHVEEIKYGESVSSHCDSEIYCGAPVYDSRQIAHIEDSLWVPAGKPSLYVPTVLSVLNISNKNPTTRIYSFEAKGPCQMGLYISPKQNFKLRRWSWGDGKIPEAEYVRNGRPSYFIILASGNPKPTFTFELEVDTPENSIDPSIDIVLSGKYFESSLLQYTGEFTRFLNSFPKWAHLWHWVATYESRVF